jgi:hypothetical protein
VPTDHDDHVPREQPGRGVHARGHAAHRRACLFHHFFPCTSLTPCTQGISYSAIIIRVGLGVAERSHNASASSGSAPRSRSRLQTLSHSAVSHEYPLKVTVTQQIDRDGGADVDAGVESRATGRTSSEDKHQQPWEIV